MLLYVFNFDSCLVDSFGEFNSQLTGMVAAVKYRTDIDHFFLLNGVNDSNPSHFLRGTVRLSFII